MMSILVALLVIALGAGGARVAERYDFKMISSGANRPGVPIGSSPYREILVGLHEGRPTAELGREIGLGRDSLDRVIARLRAEGLIRDHGRGVRPTCMVVNRAEGDSLAALADEVAGDAMPLLREAAAGARAGIGHIAGLRGVPGDEAAFFVASDVLLDNWQIRAIERGWLGAERPLRGSARYYAALFARAGGEREPFGIYGNQVIAAGPDRLLGVYGNRRGSADDLARLPAGRLAAMAGIADSTDRRALLAAVLDRIVAAARADSPAPLPGPLARALGGMHLLRDGRPAVAVLDTADLRRLSDRADTLTDSLVATLRRADPRLRRSWTRSRWHDEITYDEFRIWWYHFFYTALTDRLAAEGRIRIPATGLFHYVIVR